MLKGRESEARDVLRKTLSKRGQEAIEEELDDIRRLDTTSNRSFCEELKLMLKWKNLKRYQNIMHMNLVLINDHTIMVYVCVKLIPLPCINLFPSMHTCTHRLYTVY